MKVRAGLGAVVLLGMVALASSCGSDFSSDDGNDADAATGGTGGGVGCPPGTKRCGGQCVSKEEPNVGCGSEKCSPCFIPQATSYVCQDSECIAKECESGFDQCDVTPECENINTHDNCGSCGTVCPPNWFCNAGSCTDQCPSGTEPCNGTCSNVQTDISNCGSCGNACSAPNAQVTCEAGQCAFSCNPEFEDCNKIAGDGCEAHLFSEPQNCGDCVTVCDVSSGIVCEQGACACGPPLLQCGARCVDPLTDPQHCNSCNACLHKEYCDQGDCQIPKCAWGMQECSGTCTNVQTDGQNCGQCGNACPSGACIDGGCVNNCPVGEICDGCTALTFDPSRCGVCDKKCGPGQACIDATCIDSVVASNAGDCPEQACPVPAWWNPPPGVSFICLSQTQTCPPP
jgi:hypothetical protein